MPSAYLSDSVQCESTIYTADPTSVNLAEAVMVFGCSLQESAATSGPTLPQWEGEYPIWMYIPFVSQGR